MAKHFTHDEISLFCFLYENGASLKDLRAYFKKDPSNIWRKIKQFNLKRLPKKTFQDLLNEFNRPKFPTTIFHHLSDKELTDFCIEYLKGKNEK